MGTSKYLFRALLRRKMKNKITYKECVRQNKALLREDKRLAKLPKEVDIKKLIWDIAYAKSRGVIGPSLSPYLQEKVQDYLRQLQEPYPDE
jgi:hypothetical protein